MNPIRFQKQKLQRCAVRWAIVNVDFQLHLNCLLLTTITMVAMSKDEAESFRKRVQELIVLRTLELIAMRVRNSKRKIMFNLSRIMKLSLYFTSIKRKCQWPFSWGANSIEPLHFC